MSKRSRARHKIENQIRHKKYYQLNKDRIAIETAEKRKLNPEHFREQKHKSWEKHKLKKRESNRLWAKNNKDKVRAIALRRRNKNKLAYNMRTMVWRGLKGLKAGRSWEKLVGYSLDDLKSHIEGKFQPGMTWENYGSYWHLDHKIPQSWFKFQTDTDEDFKKCWSLDNLQPLQAFLNISKSNRYAD